MKGKIAKSLTSKGFPGLLKATKHNETAHRLAKQYLENMERIGHKTGLEMDSSDRLDAIKCNQIAAFLLVEENKGAF